MDGYIFSEFCTLKVALLKVRQRTVLRELGGTTYFAVFHCCSLNMFLVKDVRKHFLFLSIREENEEGIGDSRQ